MERESEPAKMSKRHRSNEGKEEEMNMKDELFSSILSELATFKGTTTQDFRRYMIQRYHLEHLSPHSNTNPFFKTSYDIRRMRDLLTHKEIYLGNASDDIELIVQSFLQHDFDILFDRLLTSIVNYNVVKINLFEPEDTKLRETDFTLAAEYIIFALKTRHANFIKKIQFNWNRMNQDKQQREYNLVMDVYLFVGDHADQYFTQIKESYPTYAAREGGFGQNYATDGYDFHTLMIGNNRWDPSEIVTPNKLAELWNQSPPVPPIIVTDDKYIINVITRNNKRIAEDGNMFDYNRWSNYASQYYLLDPTMKKALDYILRRSIAQVNNLVSLDMRQTLARQQYAKPEFEHLRVNVVRIISLQDIDEQELQQASRALIKYSAILLNNGVIFDIPAEFDPRYREPPLLIVRLHALKYDFLNTSFIPEYLGSVQPIDISVEDAKEWDDLFKANEEEHKKEREEAELMAGADNGLYPPFDDRDEPMLIGAPGGKRKRSDEINYQAEFFRDLLNEMREFNSDSLSAFRHHLITKHNLQQIERDEQIKQMPNPYRHGRFFLQVGDLPDDIVLEIFQTLHGGLEQANEYNDLLDRWATASRMILVRSGGSVERQQMKKEWLALKNDDLELKQFRDIQISQQHMPTGNYLLKRLPKDKVVRFLNLSRILFYDLMSKRLPLDPTILNKRLGMPIKDDIDREFMQVNDNINYPIRKRVSETVEQYRKRLSLYYNDTNRLWNRSLLVLNRFLNAVDDDYAELEPLKDEIIELLSQPNSSERNDKIQLTGRRLVKRFPHHAFQQLIRTQPALGQTKYVHELLKPTDDDEVEEEKKEEEEKSNSSTSGITLRHRNHSTQSLEVSVCLHLTLDQDGKHDQYGIMLFASGSDPTHYIPLHKRTLHANQIQIDITNDEAQYLHAFIFLTTREDDRKDHALTTVLDSWGTLPLSVFHNKDDVLMPVVDILNQQQGTLTITCSRVKLNRRESEKDLDYLSNQLQQSTDAISQIMGTYRYDRQQKFFSFKTPFNGDVALLCYPLLAYRTTHNNQVAFLTRLFDYACAILHVNVDADSPDIVLGNVLGEMCTLVNRCLLYEADYTRSITSMNQLLETDAWTSLFSFPAEIFSTLGYDCEDAAACAMEILYSLKDTKGINNKGLLAIQEFLNQYTICCTLCKIYAGDDDDDEFDGYVPHCTVTLLDTRYYEYLTKGTEITLVDDDELVPALLLEGTCYLSPVWDKKQWKTSTYRDTDIQQGEAEEVQFFVAEETANPRRGQKFRKLLHNRVSTYDTYKERTYGPVARLLVISSDEKPSAQHIALLDTDNKMGMKMEDLLFYKGKHNQAKVIETWEFSTIVETINQLQELPLSHFPHPSSSSSHLSMLSSEERQARFTIRWRDWEENQQEIETALKTRFNDTILHVTKIEISKNIAMAVLDLG